MTDDAPPPALSLIVVSDFVCPWCYVGLQQVPKLAAKQELKVRFAPYLLDPTTPPEGKPARKWQEEHGEPTYLEQRAAAEGITFEKGRTWQPSSLLAHEAAEFVAEHHGEHSLAFHQAVFHAHFTEMADIGSAEVLVAAGESVGVPGAALREALDAHTYRLGVHEALAWAQDSGIRSVPTFIFNEEWAVVGAQEWPYFEEALKLAASPAAAS